MCCGEFNTTILSCYVLCIHTFSMSPNRKLTDSQNWSISVLLEGNSATEVGSRLSSGFHLNTFFCFSFCLSYKYTFFTWSWARLCCEPALSWTQGKKKQWGTSGWGLPPALSQLSCLSPGIWKLGAEPLDWVSVHLDAKPTRPDYGTTKFGYLDTHAQEEHHGGQVVQDVPPRSLHALEGAANVEYAFAPDGIVIVGLCHCQGRGLGVLYMPSLLVLGRLSAHLSK